MLFSSLTFVFLFLPILIAIYFLNKNIKVKNLIIVVFSILFYSWGEPKYVLLFLTVIVLTYFGGIMIDHFDKAKKLSVKKIAFIASVILIVCNLIFFKYINFIVYNINLIPRVNFPLANITLPIGISFYTFQILSYLIDLYNGKVRVQKSLLNLTLYVSFFPQLIAGPIVRYETIEKEIGNRVTSWNDAAYGARRFIVGLSKKVLIANQMAIIADAIFNSHATYLGTSAYFLGAICYSFQIYFDFSGYSDMAIGLGRIFGFHFLENFDYPYTSKSITEFFRRWHISLSSWFRDYIYIPLGGNRVSKTKLIRNILIVWCLTGLWHGASWNFVIWGLYYGIFLIIEKLFLKNILDKLPSVISWVFTMFIVLIGWTIFRVENLSDLVFALKNMVVFSSTKWYMLFENNISIIYSMLFIIPAIIFSTPIYRCINDKYGKKTLFIIINDFILLVLFAITIVFLVSYNYNPFIYFRF